MTTIRFGTDGWRAAIAEEFEAIYAKDRVDTTGAVFLGLTVGCATCHDHKFDPISQRDFYSLAAFFRNTTQGPFDGNIPDTPPVLVVPKDEDAQRWKQIQSEESRLRERLKSSRAGAEVGFAEWLNSRSRRDIELPLEGPVLGPAPRAQGAEQPLLVLLVADGPSVKRAAPHGMPALDCQLRHLASSASDPALRGLSPLSPEPAGSGNCPRHSRRRDIEVTK